MQYEGFPEYFVPGFRDVCPGRDPLPLFRLLRYRCHCRHCLLPRPNLRLRRLCPPQAFPNSLLFEQLGVLMAYNATCTYLHSTLRFLAILPEGISVLRLMGP